MVNVGRIRFARYRERLRTELRRSFSETHTPREIARSFALGTFITMLPTLGTGFLLFVLIVYFFDWVSKLALLASVIVFNPLVKWGVYVASFALGVLFLGPVQGVSLTDVSFSAGPAILARLLLGNLILAVIASVGSYVIVYRLAVRYTSTEIAETVNEALEEVAEAVLEP